MLKSPGTGKIRFAAGEQPKRNGRTKCRGVPQARGRTLAGVIKELRLTGRAKIGSADRERVKSRIGKSTLKNKGDAGLIAPAVARRRSPSSSDPNETGQCQNQQTCRLANSSRGSGRLGELSFVAILAVGGKDFGKPKPPCQIKIRRNPISSSGFYRASVSGLP